MAAAKKSKMPPFIAKKMAAKKGKPIGKAAPKKGFVPFVKKGHVVGKKRVGR